MPSRRPPYAGHMPGTDEWMTVWRGYPSWQDEMLSYAELLKAGIQPIVQDVDGFRVSNSALNTVGCSVKALLRYGFKVLPQESIFAALVGASIHKGLACYFRTGEADKAYNKFLDSFPEGAPSKDNLSVDNVGVIMHHYLHEVLKSFPYYVHPSLIEIWFEQVLSRSSEGEEPIILVGRIDLMPEDPASKAMMVLDWKSTGKISDWWLKKWRMDSGLNGYVWAAQQFMPSKLFPGGVIGAIELPKLPVPGKKCKRHGVDYAECRKFHPQHQVFSVAFEPHLTEEWARSAVWSARRLRDLIRDYSSAPEGVKYVRMTGRFCGLCTFCEYIDFCMAGRPVEWINSILQRRDDIEGLEG